MTIKHCIFFLLSLYSFLFFSCSNNKEKTDDELYEKTIITDNKNKPKIKVGDKVTLYYCLKNKEKVIMSSDLAADPTVVTISETEKPNKFERPLLWLGLGDSCVVHIREEDAVAELLSYKEHFKTGDKATFIYKVLKIE